MVTQIHEFQVPTCSFPETNSDGIKTGLQHILEICEKWVTPQMFWLYSIIKVIFVSLTQKAVGKYDYVAQKIVYRVVLCL